jgi:hypothetical protein
MASALPQLASAHVVNRAVVGDVDGFSIFAIEFGKFFLCEFFHSNSPGLLEAIGGSRRAASPLSSFQL